MKITIDIDEDIISLTRWDKLDMREFYSDHPISDDEHLKVLQLVELFEGKENA